MVGVAMMVAKGVVDVLVIVLMFGLLMVGMLVWKMVVMVRRLRELLLLSPL